MTELSAHARPPRGFDDVPDEDLARDSSRDRQAFAEIYRRHADAIYRFMRYRAGEQDAQDLTAQVFFHAYRACDQFRAESSYRSWLFRIARNTLISHHRGNANAAVPLPELPELADGDDVACGAADRAEAVVLWGVVQELAPGDRELVVLRFVEGLGSKEIAHVVGASPGAIRVRLHRLLRRLRRRLEEKGVER